MLVGEHHIAGHVWNKHCFVFLLSRSVTLHWYVASSFLRFSFPREKTKERVNPPRIQSMKMTMKIFKNLVVSKFLFPSSHCITIVRASSSIFIITTTVKLKSRCISEHAKWVIAAMDWLDVCTRRSAWGNNFSSSWFDYHMMFNTRAKIGQKSLQCYEAIFSFFCAWFIIQQLITSFT